MLCSNTSDGLAALLRALVASPLRVQKGEAVILVVIVDGYFIELARTHAARRRQ
eukprot:COSAG01_NODE_910_length_12784_cov_15.136460_11_plen_54_part_00